MPGSLHGSRVRSRADICGGLFQIERRKLALEPKWGREERNNMRAQIEPESAAKVMVDNQKPTKRHFFSFGSVVPAKDPF